MSTALARRIEKRESLPVALPVACLSGGMELLFGNQKTVEAEVPQRGDGQVR